MPRELITVQVGQCGNQIGCRFWEAALQEHAAYNPAGVYDDALSRWALRARPCCAQQPPPPAAQHARRALRRALPRCCSFFRNVDARLEPPM